MWEQLLQGEPTGGIAVADGQLFLADRDFLDQFDRFVSLDANTGQLLWQAIFPQPGMLDYGNTSRATPLIKGNHAYFQSAFGTVYCFDNKIGQLVWQRNVIQEFGADRELVWGLCSSPLSTNNQLIFNPGGATSSLVSMNAKDGEVTWTTPGRDFGYGSFIVHAYGGKTVVIGHDKTSLGGWDATTGERLWEIIPEEADDFNVPTPVVSNNLLIIATENNGCRSFDLGKDASQTPKHVATQEDLCPETTSPIAVDGLVFGVANGTLYCLDRSTLKIQWEQSIPELHEHASLVSDGKRLALLADGSMILADVDAKEFRLQHQQALFEPGTSLYSHPAIVGDHLYCIGKNSIRCYKLQ